MQNINFKNKQWLQKRQQKLKSMRDDLIAERLNECTFSPSLPLHPKAKKIQSKAKTSIKRDDVESACNASDENVSFDAIPLTPPLSPQQPPPPPPPDGLRNSVLLFSRCINAAVSTSPRVMQTQGDSFKSDELNGDDKQDFDAGGETHVGSDAVVDDHVYVSDNLFV